MISGARFARRRGVAQVDDREDHEQQDRGADDLVQEARPTCRTPRSVLPLPGSVEKTPWVLMRRARVDLAAARRCSSSAPAARRRTRRAICASEYGSTLRQEKPAEHRHRDRDGRVQVRAGHPAGDVDAERDAEAPGPGDRVVVAEPAVEHPCRPDLGDHADAEQDQDHRARELGRHLPEQRLGFDCLTSLPSRLPPSLPRDVLGRTRCVEVESAGNLGPPTEEGQRAPFDIAERLRTGRQTAPMMSPRVRSARAQRAPGAVQSLGRGGVASGRTRDGDQSARGGCTSRLRLSVAGPGDDRALAVLRLVTELPFRRHERVSTRTGWPAGWALRTSQGPPRSRPQARVRCRRVGATRPWDAEVSTS